MLTLVKYNILVQDVVDRRVENGKLYTTRFLVKKQRLPASIMWLVPAKHKACYVKETSVVRPIRI